jgi:arylsulfatase A-like enzyme
MKDAPNILLVFTDQQQQKLLGCYGNTTVQTPCIDALSREGATFENAIVAQPVCTASRASLLTGTYGHTHGCVKNNQVLTEENPTYGEIFREHGYRVGYVGKWHCGNEPIPQRGFEGFYRSMEGTYVAGPLRQQGICTTYDQWLKDRGRTPEKGGATFSDKEVCFFPEEDCKMAFEAWHVDEFFRTLDERPFFLTVSITEPHPPYFSPFDDMYGKDTIDLPANYHVDDGEIAGWSRRTAAFRQFYHELGHNIFTGDPSDVREKMARYFGLISLVDKYVGKVLDLLGSYGHAEDTVVMFTSDHGDMMGSHQIVDKGMMFEESLKVPFIVRHPGEDFAGKRLTKVINNVDVVPTLLDMAGLPIPDHIQGHSFLPVLRGEENGFPPFGVGEWNGFLQAMHARQPYFADVLDACIRCVVTDRHKLVLSPGDRPEFYDLEVDPLEQRNTVADPENRETVDLLYDCLREWQKETEDPLEVAHPLEG